MAKEDKPLEYERRDLDTKGLAQRVDLNYMRRPDGFALWKRKLTWLVPLACLAGVLPFLTGIGPTRKVFTNGPMTRVHASFENRCENCHASGVTQVRDQECKSCHDGAIHVVNAKETVRCAECHTEHRGNKQLTELNDMLCTRCHADLPAHGTNIKLAANIRGFKPTTHPDWFPKLGADNRPLKLNHAKHMPTETRSIRNVTLPMKCTDCHQLSTDGSNFDIQPVTFEKNCRSCHTQELQFDRFQVLGADAQPSPHTKDPNTIHAFVQKTYQDALAKDPELWRKTYIGRDGMAGSREAWLASVVKESEAYLFDTKCRYCHEYESVQSNGFPVVKKVNAIKGRHAAAQPEGEPWLQRGLFGHRAHRAESCESCHTKARASTLTSDILISPMSSCTVCHGATNSALDNCAQCHNYHDHRRDKESVGRPVQQLISRLRFSSGVF